MRASPAHRWSLLAAALWACSSVGHAEHYTVPLFVTSTSADAATGVVRILNNTDEFGSVEIHAVDDAGMRFGTATFTLGARAAAEFNAADLVSGNAAKGLSGGIGAVTGDVSLEIDSALPIEPLAYVLAPDGTLAVMHDTVRATSVAGPGGHSYEVPIFNPASNVTQASRLRLINPNDEAATVSIEGLDDSGAAATGGEVQLTLPAGGARTLTALQLEAGDASIEGRLGAGTGRWRLTVSADRPVRVVSVTVSLSGYWNNLSTTAVRGPAPEDHVAFNERFNDVNVVYETHRVRFTLSIQTGDRFTETAEADGVAVNRSGGYRYSGIGPDAGRLELEYDGSDECRGNYYFTTPTGGWFASLCTGTDSPADGTWLGGTWFADDGSDTSPDFGEADPGDRSYRTVTAIGTLTLPEATGGDGALTYSLSPEVPGLGFDENTRELTGSPSTVGTYAMTYTVTDDDGDIDTIRFTIKVLSDAVAEGDCYVGLVLGAGEHCRYPGAGEEFLVNVRGRGSFLDRLAGIRIQISNETIDGRVYDLHASHQGDGVWRIDRIEGRTEPPGADALTGTAPSFGSGTGPNNRIYTLDVAIEPWTLPEASGGEGTLTYSLLPEVPGLGFDPATRRLSGTPTTTGSYVMTYTVMDRDGDTDTRQFTITVSAGGASITLYAGGTVIPALPVGNWIPDATMDAKAILGDTEVVVEMNHGGYFDEGGDRYTCRNMGGCVISNRTVLSGAGQIEQTPVPPEVLPTTGSREDDRAALEAVFNDMDGAYWAASWNWLSDRPLDQWYGVETDSNGRVTALYLDNNLLQGPISPELGRLTELRVLYLSENELTGSIPPELGNLSKLEELILIGNPLTGTIPPQLGGLVNLRAFVLFQTGVTGIVPGALWERVERGELDMLFAGDEFLGTSLYGIGAPPQRDVRRVFQVDPAANGNAAHHSVSFYQGPLVWRWNWRDAPVEHQQPVLGRRAAIALRVDHGIPEPPLVITRVLDAQGEVLTERLPDAVAPRTWSLASASWRTEYVFDLPGALYQAGHQLVHVIDPDGEMPETDEGDNVGGPIRLHGVKLPPFRITFLPLHSTRRGPPIVDPDALMAFPWVLWPIADDYESTIAAPIESNSTRPADLMALVTAAWNVNADPWEFYHGVFHEPRILASGVIEGLAARSQPVAVSFLSQAITVPHELGHNLSLGHPPGCGAENVEELYPYPNGRLGETEGWDANWRRFVYGEDGLTDIMSYCEPQGFVSDYNYRRTLEYRLLTGGPSGATATQPLAPTAGEPGWGPSSAGPASTGARQAVVVSGETGGLALSGRVNASETWSLTHAQSTEKGPRRPSPDGEYMLVLLGADGVELYREPLSKITYSEGGEAGWAARVPTPPQPARQVAIMDAQGVEVLREALSALE